MSNWRHISTAPKDKVILVCEHRPGRDSKMYEVVIPAMWGRPKGFSDSQAGWWGMSFSLTSEVMFDNPELRAGLLAISPKLWKPYPGGKPAKKKRRSLVHYAIMSGMKGIGQVGCARGINLADVRKNLAAEDHNNLVRQPVYECPQCNPDDV